MSACALNVEVSGPERAPVLVLGGSLGTTLAMWEPQLPALERSVRVVRIDHRGHGGSPVPAAPYTLADLGADVLAVLDRLGLERVSYAGVSLGGMIGLWLAVHAPERIDRLVAICSSAHVEPGPFHERARAVRAAGSTRAIADAVVERWLTPAYAAAHPERREWLRAMVIGTDPEGYAGCCEAIAGLDLRSELGSVRAPALVVGGAQDASLPATEHAERVAAAIPGARYELLDPAAHIPTVERADAVNRLILGHLSA